MARQFSLPQNLKIVPLLAPTTSNLAVDSRRMSMKGVSKAWIVVEMLQAVGHATAVTLKQATAVTGGTTATGPTSQNWLNENATVTDALTKQANGTAVTVTNDVKSKQVVFEVDPSLLTDGSAYAYVTIAASSQATNFVSVVGYALTSYQQASPPTLVA